MKRTLTFLAGLTLGATLIAACDEQINPLAPSAHASARQDFAPIVGAPGFPWIALKHIHNHELRWADHTEQNHPDAFLCATVPAQYLDQVKAAPDFTPDLYLSHTPCPVNPVN
jgi:hypothetical protein